jgi:betaine reductase
VPAVLVTALAPLAESVGALRIVQGKSVTHPFGDPDLDTDDELAYRRAVVETAIRALESDASSPTIFEVGNVAAVS